MSVRTCWLCHGWTVIAGIPTGGKAWHDKPRYGNRHDDLERWYSPALHWEPCYGVIPAEAAEVRNCPACGGMGKLSELVNPERERPYTRDAKAEWPSLCSGMNGGPE